MEEMLAGIDKRATKPFMLAIGDVKSLLFEEHFVFINGNLLPTETLLKGLNTCFKAFLAFNMEFPTEVNNIFSFLDCAIFKLNKNILSPIGNEIMGYLCNSD